MKKIANWLQRNSLWIVGFGLMLASSGIDGAYMKRWMPAGLGWTGYVLNTTSDITGEVLMYWFGRFRQEPKNTKKYKMAWALLPAEIIAVVYSWFFSWRQLRLILPMVEGEETEWVSAISAAFIPLMLAAIGYAQALIAGKMDVIEQPLVTIEQPVAAIEQPAAIEQSVVLLKVPTVDSWRAIVGQNGNNDARMSEADVQRLLSEHGFAPAAKSTARRWSRMPVNREVKSV